MEIGKSNNHPLHSVLLWTAYQMTRCFAFQSFKNCAGICRASCKGNAEMRMKMATKSEGQTVQQGRVLGPAKKPVKWLCGIPPQPHGDQPDCREIAVSQDSLENSSKKELRNKKLTLPESTAPGRDTVLQSSTLQPPAPARFWLLRAWAPGTAQSSSGASSHSCPRSLAPVQPESQLHSGNFKTKCKCIFSSENQHISNCANKCEPLYDLFPTSIILIVVDLTQNVCTLMPALSQK